MNAQLLRQKAEHTRALAQQITDERARVAALNLAADYERQAVAAADAERASNLPASAWGSGVTKPADGRARSGLAGHDMPRAGRG